MPMTTPIELFPYQKEAVEFARGKSAFLLADSMGLGLPARQLRP